MKTLVILAAGMGSRFGGLKQIEPLGPNGEFIIDYSIYDAIKAGFERCVFIIKEENYEIFKNTIGRRVEDKIDVKYAFQKMDLDIPDRVKPLGTAHAIMSAKEYVPDTFIIINADDYYGEDAFKKASDFLSTIKPYEYGVIGYKAINTITSNGEVKRGVLKTDNNYLTDIVESKIKKEDALYATPINKDNYSKIEDDTLVSMNMLLFDKTLFKFLEEDFEEFKNNMKDELKDEFLIPEVLYNHIKKDDIKVKVIETSSVWYGVTYKEDAPLVREGLKKLHGSIYPEKLW